MKTGGAGQSDLAKRATKSRVELMGGIKNYDPTLENKVALQIAKQDDNDNSNITNGFDYKTFIDEAFRVMKKPNMFIWCSPMQIRDIINYIYIYTRNTNDIGMVQIKPNTYN